MDFLDPQKQRAHKIRLLLGYVLLAIAVALATTVLLYQAQGFGVKEGKVIQKGTVYVNSSPGPAVIELNGRRVDTTNARLEPEAGTYTMKLTRNGYRDWQRAMTVEGGSVEHFAYPWLIPKQLSPAQLTSYSAEPSLVTQSPDRRWLLVQVPVQISGQVGTFDVYDTKDTKAVRDQSDQKKAAALKQTLVVPANLFTIPAADNRRLQAVEWSNDNTNVLLRHESGGQSEYILFNRRTPAESANVTQRLRLTAAMVISLQDKKSDRYFIQDTAAKTLSTANLPDADAAPQIVPLLTGVQAYKTYGSDIVLYASLLPAQAGQPDKAQVKLLQDRKQHTIRTVAAGDTYLLGLSRYEGDWLVMAGVPAENRVLVYRNPADALRREPSRAPVPAAALKVANPSSAAFSANSQLLMTQGGTGNTDFAVYDAKYDRSHTYHMDSPIDAPQPKAAWVDSHHLQYVSGGQVMLFDYDGTNRQTLTAQSPALPAMFDTGYVTLYTVAPSGGGASVLSATPLRTTADQ